MVFEGRTGILTAWQQTVPITTPLCKRGGCYEEPWSTGAVDIEQKGGDRGVGRKGLPGQVSGGRSLKLAVTGRWDGKSSE